MEAGSLVEMIVGAVSPAAEGFLADLEGRGRAANTLAAYRRDLLAYERFLAGRGLTVAAAGAGDVTAYLAGLEAAGRRPASVARALVALRSLHRWCGNDAAGDVDGPEPAAVDPTVLTEAEAAALVESATGTSVTARRDRALLELLYATGARISEVVGLGVDDVGDGLAHVGGRNPRVVPYGEPAAAALAAWLGPGGWGEVVASGPRSGPGSGSRSAPASGSRPVSGSGPTSRLGSASGSGPESAGSAAGSALLLNQRGGRLSRQWGWSVVRSHGDRLDLAGRLGPHLLRHSFAAHLAARGAPPAAVQQLLVGQPRVLGTDELVEGYRRWHPRGIRHTSPEGASSQ